MKHHQAEQRYFLQQHRWSLNIWPKISLKVLSWIGREDAAAINHEAEEAKKEDLLGWLPSCKIHCGTRVRVFEVPVSEASRDEVWSQIILISIGTLTILADIYICEE